MTERSILYVPGDRPDRFDKAAASGADAIILDIEDAVAYANKHEAREAVSTWLTARDTPTTVWVRLNSGDLLDEDLRALPLDRADGLYVAKASAASIAHVASITDRPLTALIETARGVLDVEQIAAATTVARLAIGEADLGAELAITDETAFGPMRAAVILASAAAGIDPPVGPVTTDFRDLAALGASTTALRASGFGGRAAIHPAQVPVINDAFTPSPGEIEAAKRLIALLDKADGGVTLDDQGRMIDEAFVRAARRTLRNA